ncbi:MAG TPA: response regulator [Chitinophagaceae bacterium]
MNHLLQVITYIRSNGCNHLQEDSTRQVEYANMIWLVSYLTYFIHSTAIAVFVEVPVVEYLTITAIFHLLYISFFFLVKNNRPRVARHWLITTTYLAVAVFDHISRKETFTYLYLFASLPFALHILSLAKNKFFAGAYVLFPLLYALFTKLFDYSYPLFPEWPKQSVMLISTITISIAFALFLSIAGYMILDNITKQKKLFSQIINLQATLDHASAAVWSIDNDFNLTTTNTRYVKSIEQEFGLTDIKAGVNIKKHELWQKLPAAFKEQYNTVLRGEEIVHETELNGKFFEIKGVPVYDTNGKIQGARFGSRDITERKKSEDVLLNAKKAAEDATQAKARFLSNMSHEIRTPLNGIIGITRIMQDEEYLPKQFDNLKTLQDLSEHTLQLVNSILDFAKIEAGKASLESKRFNLKRFIDKIHSIFSGTAQLKGIRLNIDTVGPIDIFVKGDEVRLSQILINLLGNAFKFTEKGSITFKTEILDNSTSENYKVRFSVADTGIGIKEENIGKIFESFSQADQHTTRRFGGTGLGLSLAGKILGLMNSELIVESEYAKGSVFFFDIELPKSSKISPVKTIPNIQNNDALSNIKILLAEDNKVNQVVANRILQKWKANVFIASNGQEAVELSQQHKFDVILMDLDMPVMDGYESASIIKGHFPEMPVIALTAAAFDDMNTYLVNKGFTSVVQKPFMPDELYNKIISALQAA